MKKESYNKLKEKQSKAPAPKAPAVVAPEERQAPKIMRNMIVELSITAIDDDGYGTARVDGLAYKIGGALPGDVIRAKIDHASFGTVIGHLHKLLQFSPLRSKRPPCSVSAECLGCPLIAMRYTCLLYTSDAADE